MNFLTFYTAGPQKAGATPLKITKNLEGIAQFPLTKKQSNLYVDESETLSALTLKKQISCKIPINVNKFFFALFKKAVLELTPISMLC